MKRTPLARPEVSILMTAFNTAPYVEEAIESILQQRTARTWELLFVDDGSTDETYPIAIDYARRFPGIIRVLTHAGHVNRGISASRNLAMQHARAPLIAFLDSDDVWLPHHVEEMTSLLDRMPAVTMAYAAAERWVDQALPFDETRSRAARWGSNYLPPMVPAGEPIGLLPRGRLLRWFLQDQSLVPCICTVVVRTDAARAVGGFCAAFRGLYDDQVFHAKIATRYDVYARDVCVARYRQHTNSTCARAVKDHDAEEREHHRFKVFLSELSHGAAAQNEKEHASSPILAEVQKCAY